MDDFDNNGDDENDLLNKVASEEVDLIVLVHKWNANIFNNNS